jgi:type IV pilus assembly protein PilF
MMTGQSRWIGALIVASVAWTGCTGADKQEEQRIKDADMHYKLGAGYFEGKQVPLAIRELTLALEGDPKHLRAHYLMGYIYMGRRDYTKAIRHFRAALEIDPKFFDAKNSLGAVYLSTKQWQEAQELFEQLLEEPMYTSPELAHNNLGWLYYSTKKYHLALDHFKMATFLKPEFCLGFNNTGLAHEGMENWFEAKQAYSKAINLCPTNYAEPHFNLGKLLQEDGDRYAAREHFQRCVELAPDSQLGTRCREYLR